jgi:hypothetical protein
VLAVGKADRQHPKPLLCEKRGLGDTAFLKPIFLGVAFFSRPEAEENIGKLVIERVFPAQ